jgi:murein DD-endopeptidase MepM/ murein hydrolase activator NlpD
MAIDLRVPPTRKCRAWLENTLLSLEKQHVVDVTREHYPPHYHVAVFSKNYETRVAANSGSGQGNLDQLRAANGLRGNLIHAGQTLRIPSGGSRTGAASSDTVAMNEFTYRVSRGDTLWRIANRYGTSVEKLRQSNRQASDSLQVGQLLKISKG